MQRSIATTILPFYKRQLAGGPLVWVIFTAITLLVCTGEILAQPPAGIDVPKPSKKSPKTTEIPDEDLLGEGTDEELPDYEDPPRELITPEELEVYRKNRSGRAFNRALLAGKRSGASDKIIREGIRVYVYRMTLKENQRKVRFEMEKLLRQLRSAGTREKRLAPLKLFRTFICQETLSRAKELLDNNNEVRLNAAILISELNVIEPKSVYKPPAESYSPATAVLLDIIKDEKQPVPVKIQAARGITRHSLLGVPKLKVLHKNELVKAIVKELKTAKKLSRDQAGPWYQTRLLETLAAIDLPTTTNNQPVIFETLEDFLGDSELELGVRCMAARSLGRARLGSLQIDSQGLSLKLAKLGLELTNGYNKNFEKNNKRVSLTFYRKWQKHFWDLYIAFKPENDYDKALYKSRKLGLLAKFSNRKEIQDAYQKILPLAAHVLKQPADVGGGRRRIQPIQQNQIQALSNWIKNHPQASNSLIVPLTEPVATDSP